jgi:protocatechuate 3,4-dioxygenase beta subunit
MRIRGKYIALTLAAALAGSSMGSAQVQIVTTEPADGIPFPAPGRQMKTGTGQIKGRVLAVETGNPIRRAQVRISGTDIMPRTALTDADGRFEFRDLPAGRFTLNATKSGFVSVQFGQTRPFESGRSIELADKQVLDAADITMPRGSVISGRIVDEFGDPMPDVTVSALRQSWSGGRRRLTPAPGRLAQTNDLGQFRLYGLPPGEYYVSATMRNSSGPDFMAIEMMAATRGGAVAAPSESTPSSGYAATYYPGTSSPGDAQRISLIAGQEHSSADFALMPVRLARITGVVIGSDGKPMAGAMINLTPASREGSFMPGLPSSRSTQDGSFTINGVAPGDYRLNANAVQVTTTSEGGNTTVMVRTFVGAGGGVDAEFGSVPLTVAGDDIANIVLVTAKGGTATGRVVFEDGAKPPSPGTIRISAQPADADGPVMSFGGGSAGVVKPDGAFELRGLSGTRLIRAVNLPPGWMLESVRFNGTDITDTGAEFRSGEAITGLEVALTAKTTSITGGVTSGSGSPLKDYTVVIFADNEELWRLPNTRWVTGRRPDQEGRFKIENMPPGTYHAVAVEYIPQGEWLDPDVLARLKGKGKRFSLGEGGIETLDLKLADD